MPDENGNKLSGSILQKNPAYAIMPTGKKDENVQVACEKTQCSSTGSFLFRCGGAA